MYFFSLSGYRCLGDGGTDRREILHDGRLHIGPGQDAPFLGAVPQEIPQLTCCLLSASPMLISISIHGPKVSAFFSIFKMVATAAPFYYRFRFG